MLLREPLLEQLQALRDATVRIDALEKQLASWQRAEPECRRIMAVPGVGPLTATAVVASVADAQTVPFRTPVRCLSRLGTAPVGDRRSSQVVGDQQTG